MAATAVLLVAVALALTACGSQAAADSPCGQMVLETAGKIRPESSGMTCRQIKEMIIATPPDSSPYLQESPFTGRNWKCRGRGDRPTGPLLRCELGEAHFSIVAVG